MPLIKERTIQAVIKRSLKERGWLVWKNHGSQYSEVGLPDLMAVKESRLIALEVKRPGARPTDAQKRWIEKLREEGISAGIVSSLRDVETLIGT